MTDRKARELDIEPLAQIIAMSSIATEPHLLAEAPARAIQAVLKKTNLKTKCFLL